MKVLVLKGNEAGTVVRLHDGINMVGRAGTNRIRLIDSRVSREHCRIRKVGQSLFVSDLGTKNGTLVNGNLVTEQELKIGDKIQVGSTVLKIVDDEYNTEKTVSQSSPVSFFRRVTMAISGQSGRQKPADMKGEFAWFARRGRKPIWRPHVDTDPPKGRQETTVTQSDPD